MRKFQEYNKLKLFGFILASVVFLGTLMGVISRVFEVDLFEVYVGFPGFIFISFGAVITLQLIGKYERWLTE